MITNEEILNNAISIIEPCSERMLNGAKKSLDKLAMPPGALGQIGELTAKLISIQKTMKPQIKKRVLVLSAADHGVMAQGVSHYPQITDAIVKTAAKGGAAINAFCRQAKCDLELVDFGLVADLTTTRRLRTEKVAEGTADMTQGPAMTEEQCLQALAQGVAYGQRMCLDYDLVALGEMGLGNTTSASAIMAAVMNLEAEQTTGAGTGVSGDALAHKVTMVKKALEVNDPSSESSALEILQKVGGFEIAAMVGIILGTAACHKTVVLDGFITGAAALIAQQLCPAVTDYLFAGHQSAEKAHSLILEQLALKPLLQLDMRLGEGIGAALALNVLEASCEVLSSMMTLDEALAL